MSAVPWMPAPSKIPSQRALSGFSGTPPGITLPARSPAQSLLRHVPGRVDRLVLHVVDAGRGLEADLAHRDLVGLGQLQVLEQAQREVGAVDGHDRRVLPGQVGRGHLRLHDLHAARARCARRRSSRARPGPTRRRRRASRLRPSARDRRQAGGVEADVGVARRAVHGALDAPHEPPHLDARVGDPRLELAVHVATGDAAPHACRQTAVAAHVERLVHHAVDVGRQVRRLAVSLKRCPGHGARARGARAPARAAARRRSAAASARMPPTSTPATCTPSAIRSSRDVS